MDVPPPDNVVETVGRKTTVRTCPGCRARVDLGEYGLLVCAATVVCPACETTYRLSELVRV